MKLDELTRMLKTPPKDCRSLPFYSLNGRLDAGEVRRQTADMLNHGMGGYFLHAREGLETEYLGAEWMSAIEAAVESAREAGGTAWLYDEDRFPSGGAGGLVQRENRAAFSAHALTLALDEEEAAGDVLGAFAVRLEGDELRAFHPLKTVDAPLMAGERRALFRMEQSAGCSWYNGEAPSDNLNPDAVNAFLRLTHERYREKFGAEFGRTIPGIFTDEPTVNDFRVRYTPGRAYLPWTPGFAGYFAQQRGYDLLAQLPCLFWAGKDSFRIRHDYWRTVTERFLMAYSARIGSWCADNGLIYTGHYMGEGQLGSAARMSGAIMPHYLHQQMPGIDLLTEEGREYLTAKQASSVANQLGRRSICELYGCSGWEFTFEGQKAVGDWLCALGVDMRCQHHAMYTVRGCAKRDFPPSFNYNSVWWAHNRVTEDYFARLTAALRGRACRQVLIVHPQSTVWGLTGAGSCRDFTWTVDDRRADALQMKLEQLMRRLLAEHIDFDFGDELIMEQQAEVRGSALSIGRMDYPVVVLPWLETMTASTWALLERFEADGGCLLVMGAAPALMDGAVDERAAQAARWRALPSTDALVQALEEALPERIRLKNALGREDEELLSLLREEEDHRAFFAVNQCREGMREITVSIPTALAGRVMEADLLTGDMREVAVCADAAGISFPRRFGPLESALYLIEKDAPPVSGAVGLPPLPHPALVRSLPPCAPVTRTHPNALLLDVCRWRLNGESWQGEEQVFRVQQLVRRRLGMVDICANGSEQRYLWAEKPHPGDGAALEMEFTFPVDAVPGKPVFLALEEAERFEIFLNGRRAEAGPEGWYLDRAISTIRLPDLRAGENRLLLRCRYENACQLEDVFLIGDFGVSPARRIVPEPHELRVGDWGLQGYFHYAGGLIYHYRLAGRPEGRCVLRIGAYRGVTAQVRVNGRVAADIPWRCADGVDITAFLTDGENALDIEIMGSQRNLMGLFHKTGRQNVWVDWTFFQREDARLNPAYETIPCGLMEPPCLSDV